MRKRNPNVVRQSFRKSVNDTLEHFDRVRTGTSAKASVSSATPVPIATNDESRLAEMTFMGIAVAWECFLSDLFIAYVNQDPTQVWKTAQASLGKLGNLKPPGLVPFLSLLSTKHLTVSEVEQLLDPKRENLTFPDVSSLRTTANDYLAEEYVRGFYAMTKDDEVLYDCVKALRNCLAHRSERAKKALVDKMTIASGRPKTCVLAKKTGEYQINDIGAFLKACTKPGPTRLHEYGNRLQNLASRL